MNKIKLNFRVMLGLCLVLTILGCVKKTNSEKLNLETSDAKGVLSKVQEKVSKKDYPAAFKIIKAASENGVESAALYNEEGAIFMQLGNAADASKCFNNAVRLAPENSKFLLNYAYSEVKLKEYEEALSSYERVLKKNKKDARAYYGKGIVYFLQNDYETAVACFNQALKYRKQYLAAIYNRALAKQKIDDLQGSIDDFMACINSKYKVAESYCYLGVSKYLMGDNKTALSYITKAIKIDGEKYEFYYNKGIVSVASFNYKDAIVCFTKALVFKGDFAEAYINRGDVYMRLNEFEKGSRDLNLACNLGACVKRDQYKTLGKLVE